MLMNFALKETKMFAKFTNKWPYSSISTIQI